MCLKIIVPIFEFPESCACLLAMLWTFCGFMLWVSGSQSALIQSIWRKMRCKICTIKVDQEMSPNAFDVCKGTFCLQWDPFFPVTRVIKDLLVFCLRSHLSFTNIAMFQISFLWTRGEQHELIFFPSISCRLRHFGFRTSEISCHRSWILRKSELLLLDDSGWWDSYP